MSFTAELILARPQISGSHRARRPGGARVDIKPLIGRPHADRDSQQAAYSSYPLPPGGYVLGRTVEYLRIPRKVLTLATGKSTYARAGVLVNVTPFEPEWEGFPTISIANTTPVPVRIYANEGICQVLFFESDEACEVSYRDRKGKYQAQKEIVRSKTNPAG